MKKILQQAYEFVADLVAPVVCRCLSCDSEVFDNTGFCQQCTPKLPFNNGKTCLRCGVAIHGAEDYCGNCTFDKIYFDKGYSVFSYDGVVKDAILKMKFTGAGRFAKVLANYLVFLAQKHNLQYDLVCYVPMTKTSQKQRRYNQSELLAKYFCMAQDVDVLCHALAKIKQTERQESLGKQQRKENLVGAYKCVADVKGKRVLVIDDVKTTGSTINECAKVLKRAGATSVVGLTVASREEQTQWEIDEEI